MKVGAVACCTLFVTLIAGCTIETSSGSRGSGGSSPSASGGTDSSGGAATGGGGAVSSGGSTAGTGGTSSGGTTPTASGGTSSGGAATDDDAGEPDAGPATPDGGVPEPDCEDGKVVHFVYFVEADKTYSEAQRADVERQAFHFQKYWYDQLGVTFYLSYPVVTVIEADHDAQWYLDTPDDIHDDARWYRLGNVKTEVYRKLGIRDFDPDHRVVNYPTTRYDGHVGANFGGAWMDGDDLTCLADGGFNYPYPDGTSAHCTGHVAHEFGHVLGLDHQGPNTDCMQFGFYTTDPNDLCSFAAANVAQILADTDNAGWFDARPGETCKPR